MTEAEAIARAVQHLAEKSRDVVMTGLFYGISPDVFRLFLDELSRGYEELYAKDNKRAFHVHDMFPSVEELLKQMNEEINEMD